MRNVSFTLTYSTKLINFFNWLITIKLYYYNCSLHCFSDWQIANNIENESYVNMFKIIIKKKHYCMHIFFSYSRVYFHKM